MTTDNPFAHVKNLAKTYGPRTVISGASLTLARGDIIGLVGANGGGKTTTLKMICGLLKPNEGTGQVLGEAVDRPTTARRQHIGYMPQTNALYPDLTVAENLAFRVKIFGLANPARAVAEAAEHCGLSAVLHQRVATLSGGWAQRAHFVANILHKPALLLLDEPTAGLDVVTQHDIWGWLAALAQQGCGIVVSTHDLTEAESLPRIILYHAGRAFGPVPPAELMRLYGCASLTDTVRAIAKGQPL